MKKLLTILFTVFALSSFGQSLFNRWIPASGTDTYSTNITSFTTYSNSVVYLKFANANTTTSTININSIGAQPIRYWDGDSWEPLTGGELDVNTIYKLSYSGSYYELEVFSAPGGGGGTWGTITGTLSDQTDLQTELDAKANEAVAYNTQTSNYTLVLTDKDSKVVEMNVTGASTLTIPPNASVAFPTGSVINFKNISSDNCVLTPGAAVTFQTAFGSSLTLPQYAWGTAVKTGTNTWDVITSATGGGSALTKVDDTNVTLTLGGSPSSALAAATSITVGWSGTLALARGGKGTSTDPTTGSIWFEGASGATEDNANLFYDDTNNRLGLGTTSPTSRLHLAAGSATPNTAPLELTSGTTESPIRGGLAQYDGRWNFSSSDLNQLRVQGTIATFAAAGNNGTTAETDLQTYTTKASSLNATGDMLEFTGNGIFSDATVTAQIRWYFGGTLVGNTTALTLTGTGHFSWVMRICRTGSTTANAWVEFRTDASATTQYMLSTDMTGLTFTNTNIIKITGQAAGAGGGSNDITTKAGYVQLRPVANN